jgi:hypothetical protein
MTDRSDEGERVAVVAKLRPGFRGRASEILAEGAPYELGETGFRRHSIFLAGETVIFLFEGSGIEGLVRDLVNDPVRSAATARRSASATPSRSSPSSRTT